MRSARRDHYTLTRETYAAECELARGCGGREERAGPRFGFDSGEATRMIPGCSQRGHLQSLPSPAGAARAARGAATSAISRASASWEAARYRARPPIGELTVCYLYLKTISPDIGPARQIRPPDQAPKI